jgi:acyl-coenzyme A synthetase/AMP-(fatty) acid ligase
MPTEIEAALMALPEVVAAAVVGVPHPTLGEQLFAFIVPTDLNALAPAGEAATALTVQRALVASLPPHMRPAHIRATAVLPMTAAGQPVRPPPVTPAQAL